MAWRAAAHSRLPSSSTISICPPSSHERGIAPSRKRCTSSSASPARTNCTAAPVRGCVSAKMRASVRSGQLATKTRIDMYGRAKKRKRGAEAGAAELLLVRRNGRQSRVSTPPPKKGAIFQRLEFAASACCCLRPFAHPSAWCDA